MRTATSMLFLALIGACAPASAPEASHADLDLGRDVDLGLDAAQSILDRRGDEVITATAEPAPPGSDADRVLVLHGPAALEGIRALDARFAGASLLVLGADHVLRLVDAQGAAVEIDRHVEAPLSVSGRAVAYARGEMPFFEIARADLDTRAVRAVTEGMGPAYSPALSRDGAEIVFVSAREGRPRLHRADAQGAIHALPPTARAPSSPIAPRWEGDRLVFHDEQGRTAIELATGREVSP